MRRYHCYPHFTVEEMRHRENEQLVQDLNPGSLNHLTVTLSNFMKPRDECVR